MGTQAADAGLTVHWFFALTEASTAFRQYAGMVKVAVHTAAARTSLVPHCIYDGGENDLTVWLRNRGVAVIQHRSFVADQLTALGERKGNPHLGAALAGAFSRVELPELVTALGSPERVLYTDCDVMFLAEVVAELEAQRCQLFAVAPESAQDDYVNMNTGVMLMNTRQLRETLPAFREYISANLETLERESWDEAAYRWFYRDDADHPLWDRLPPELNWKPYWGDASNARIVHFHGPKPYQRPYIDSHWPELKRLASGGYNEMCDEFERLLRDAG